MKFEPIRRAAAALFVVSMIAGACTGSQADIASSVQEPLVEGEVPVDVQVDVVPVETVKVEPGTQISDLLSTMTLQEKIGQLLMPVLEGTDATGISAEDAAENKARTGLSQPADIVEEFLLGGVLYLPGNIESAEQLRSMSTELQGSAASSIGLGLLVAVDQEGGTVNRISDQVTAFPAAATMAADVEAVREASYITGQQLQQQGINVVLAPVADVGLPDSAGAIGDRSFGDDPQVVADMVSASVGGLQQSGVAAAAKHWPGHGMTTTDSHKALPVLDMERAAWEQRDRVPFDAAIAEDVAIVLVGHLALPQMDQSGDPATLSPVLINGLLRDELGFDGVVMTDALNMEAVDQVDSGQVAVDAVLAGADILLAPPNLAAASVALNEAVTNGDLSQETLDAAVVRVLTLKQKLGLLPAI